MLYRTINSYNKSNYNFMFKIIFIIFIIFKNNYGLLFFYAIINLYRIITIRRKINNDSYINS